MLSERARMKLRAIAETVVAAIARGENPDIPEPPEDDLELHAPRGAFVTLKIRGKLRGCIGTVTPAFPTWRAVREMAEAATSRDPRFPPVRPDEVDGVDIEVSILDPMKPVTDPADIEIGRDGLCIKRGIANGLLLPQVPTEQGWDRETFLKHTCLKAGLPEDAWRDDDVELMSFRAEVF
jgi:AmmeMemoRadiSam system protein A